MGICIDRVWRYQQLLVQFVKWSNTKIFFSISLALKVHTYIRARSCLEEWEKIIWIEIERQIDSVEA